MLVLLPLLDVLGGEWLGARGQRIWVERRAHLGWRREVAVVLLLLEGVGLLGVLLLLLLLQHELLLELLLLLHLLLQLLLLLWVKVGLL